MSAGISQGLFVANMEKTANGDRGQLKVDVNAGGKSQISAFASQHYYTGSDRHIPMASLCVPVPQGTIPKLSSSPSSGVPESTASFFPFLDGAPMLGSWISMFNITNGSGLTNTVTANSDGFLLVTLKTLSNGPRGMIRINIENNDSVEYPAGSSVHSYSASDNHIFQNSFCVPIKAGIQWSLYYNTTSDGVEYNASWIPLSSNSFQKTLDVAAGEVIKAPVDGFLFGRIWAKTNGGHGTLKLQSSDDHTFDSSIISQGSAAQQWNPEGDIYVSVNSAMIPIKKGCFYRAQVQKSDESISAKAYFIGAADFFTSKDHSAASNEPNGIQGCLEPSERTADATQAKKLVGVGMKGQLYTRETLASDWVHVPDSGEVIAITTMKNGALLGIGMNKQLWSRASLTSAWVHVVNSGEVIDVAVMSDGSILAIGTNHQLWTRASLTNEWVNVPNSGDVIAIAVMTDGTILGVGTNKQLWTRAALDSVWENVSNSGDVIGVTIMEDGSILAIGTNNQLYKREKLDSDWVHIPNSGDVIGVTSL